ncbi:hypothetical protein HMPREF0880_01479 [Yokenella regensburgei ATCC 43003]|nr:hypothetical protein HMPREF0880_01479 [Yokenella regensburgei ATCC 43003]
MTRCAFPDNSGRILKKRQALRALLSKIQGVTEGCSLLSRKLT